MKQTGCSDPFIENKIALTVIHSHIMMMMNDDDDDDDDDDETHEKKQQHLSGHFILHHFANADIKRHRNNSRSFGM